MTSKAKFELPWINLRPKYSNTKVVMSGNSFDIQVTKQNSKNDVWFVYEYFFIPLSLKKTINVQLKLLVYNYNKQMSTWEGGRGEGGRVASPPYFILKKCKFIPFVRVIFNAYLLNTFSQQWSYNTAVFPIFGDLGNHILSTQNHN